MIIEEKQPEQLAVPDERELRIPEEAPPDYNQAVSSNASSVPVTAATKPDIPHSPPPPSSAQPNAIAGPSQRTITRPTPTTNTPTSTFWSYFGRPSRTTTEVKSTVQSLIAELVRATYAEESSAILDSCAAACQDAGLSLSDLLQQPSIEGHTALYWVIVKFAGRMGSADAAPEGARSLALALLAHSAPLSPSTLSEVRAAYAIASDNALYQLCRPYLSPVGGSDRMLLSSEPGKDASGVPLDGVVVREEPETPNMFVAIFEIPMFQKRIRVGGLVSCDFVARGRVFVISFEIVGHNTSRRRKRRGNHDLPPGTWLVTISLLEHSPPTPFDSRLIIEDQTPPPPPSSLTKPQLRPPIDLRLKTETRDALLGPVDRNRDIGDVWAKLDDNIVASSLPMDRSPYITENGTLRGRLEARLSKPEADCIIC